MFIKKQESEIASLSDKIRQEIKKTLELESLQKISQEEIKKLEKLFTKVQQA